MSIDSRSDWKVQRSGRDLSNMNNETKKIRNDPEGHMEKLLNWFSKESMKIESSSKGNHYTVYMRIRIRKSENGKNAGKLSQSFSAFT
jgi:hypothetical protein